MFRSCVQLFMVFALVSRLSTGQLFRSVSCGGHHCCAIRDGAVRSLHCWGSDKYGQLGTGNYQNTSIVPWSSSLTGVVSVSAGAYHSCALTSVPGVPVARTNDDLTAPLSLYCWGYPYSGVVGIASLYETCQIRGDCLAPRPLLVPVANFDGLHVIQLSVGAVAEHVCTLAGVERLLFCWGRNTDGQTGVGTTANIPSPTKVFGFPTRSSQSVIEVITGSRHTCILMASRSVASSSTLGAIPVNASCQSIPGGCSVLCWGANENGQCGLGFTSNTPIVSPNYSDIVTSGIIQASAGDDFTCLVFGSSNGVRCFGVNNAGQAGVGRSGDAIPALPAHDVIVGVKDLAVGSKHVCVLLFAHGGVRCWGSGAFGQLGVNLGSGSTSILSFPPPLDTLSNVTLVIAGGYHTCYGNWTTGGLRCFGANQYGQVANNHVDDVLCDHGKVQCVPFPSESDVFLEPSPRVVPAAFPVALTAGVSVAGVVCGTVIAVAVVRFRQRRIARRHSRRRLYLSSGLEQRRMRSQSRRKVSAIVERTPDDSINIAAAVTTNV